MSIINNIFLSYVYPLKIFNNQVIKTSDSQLFGILVVGCLITLFGQFPSLYYKSLSSHDPFIGMFSASFIAILLIMPLFLYFCSGVIFLVLRIFKFRLISLHVRISLFWSFTLVSPWGLVNTLIKLTNCTLWFEILFSIFIFLIFCMFFCYFLKVCLKYKV